ncbi:MAG: AlpA family phage regulatory protein [Pseudomonadales bacterium]|nr:AlpA family phage regulatory protein [Pseudomonadales bacterium]
MQKSEALTPDSQDYPDRFIRIREVMSLTALSKSHIYHLSAQGRFPRSIPLVEGGTSRAWVLSDIRNWMSERMGMRENSNNQ